MIEAIKNLFGSSIDYKELVDQGAIILDVRSAGEFQSGHINGAMNIAVNELEGKLDRLPNKEIPIITCCASGMRSGSAKTLLLAKGYKAVYNGGGWMSLNKKLQTH